MIKVKNYINYLKKSRELEGRSLPGFLLMIKMLHWIFQNKGRLQHFMILGLYKKDHRIRDYVTENQFNKIHKQLNHPYYLSILEDKYVFDRFLKSFGFPMAETFGLLENGIITWIPERKTEAVENILYHDLDCFCKMITGWGGNKVYRLEIHNRVLMINSKMSSIEELKILTKDGLFILQKTIVQHSELNRLNPSCVNTLRIITVDDGMDVHTLGSFLRVGINESHVDNISAGNIGCGVHDDGTLFNYAIDADLEYEFLSSHPKTHVVFTSFKIPFYSEAIDLARQMHTAFHCFFIIAWDITITQSGPVVIEGNPINDIIWIQAYRGGLKKEFLRYASNYRKTRKLNI
jgi:hypothetical protein